MYNEFWPLWNSIWNFGSLCFLISGRIAIHRGQKELHKKLMLGALLCSAVFLGSYLYYHFHYESPKFDAQGIVRTFYFAMLISHIILAAAIVPAVILTVRWAFMKKWELHKRVARYLWPVWLYVSITGILVYIFIYHLYRPAVL